MEGLLALLLVLMIPGLLTLLPGRSKRRSVPRTKSDNCEHLLRELQGRHPTDSELAQRRLTRRAYEHFVDRQSTALPQDDWTAITTSQGQG